MEENHLSMDLDATSVALSISKTVASQFAKPQLNIMARGLAFTAA